MPEDLDTSWENVRRSLREELTDFAFHFHLAPLRPVAAVGETLFVSAPGHIRGWVQERHLPLLASAARRHIPGITAVTIVDEQWTPEVEPKLEAGLGDLAFNPRYGFDQFVICDGNRLAHAASLAVAEQPGHTYNPLFICGPPGLGKTHLLHAIGSYARRHGAEAGLYVTLEAFTSEFVGAVRGGHTAAFRERFRGVDLLLVDDVQFLADKARTKEELFHTFNALYESGRQLVFTSDRPPGEVEGLEARLAERFEWGLVAELEPPDYAARLAILHMRARLDELTGLTSETLATIASRIETSVRALEGALIRVVALASLRGEAPSPEHAERVLTRLYPAPRYGSDHVTRIQDATAAAFGLTRDDLLANDRRPQVARARQLAMYLARELTDASLPSLGSAFAGRNHSTVLHAHQRVSALLTTDAKVASIVDELTTRLGPPR